MEGWVDTGNVHIFLGFMCLIFHFDAVYSPVRMWTALCRTFTAKLLYGQGRQ